MTILRAHMAQQILAQIQSIDVLLFLSDEALPKMLFYEIKESPEFAGSLERHLPEPLVEKIKQARNFAFRQYCAQFGIDLLRARKEELVKELEAL